MLFDWIDQAREELQAMRRPRGNWGYKVGGTPAVEPSVLAALALMATDVEDTAARDFASARATADWLASVQHRDGSLPVCRRHRVSPAGRPRTPCSCGMLYRALRKRVGRPGPGCSRFKERPCPARKQSPG